MGLQGFDMSQLTPEQADALLGLASADDENQDLQMQLQQALALGKPSGTEHRTAGGAAMGGLADILNGFASRQQQSGIRKDQEGIRGRQLRGRKTFLDLLRGGQGGPVPGEPPSMGDLQEAQPLGYGGPYGYIPGQY